MVIRGAGATFPYPIYSRWALLYFEKTGLRLRYDGGGSQVGVSAIKAREVDFGASDIPLSSSALSAHGLVQFPTVVGGVVPVYNLPGLGPGALRLTPALLARIHRGKITRWDDPAIRAINPRLLLPAREIVVVYQPDRSGTAWILWRALGGGPPTRAATGSGRRPFGVPAVDNLQTARFVLRFKYTLGYVEYTYAVKHQLSWARLRNRHGSYCVPGREAFEAAVQDGSWSRTVQDGAPVLTTPGKLSWPITGASYILIPKEQADARRALQMLRFFRWALTRGTGVARSLDYATIPARQVRAVERAWGAQITSGGKKIWSDPG